ncbi:o-succinylbenzoate synthase [Crocosphaera sp. UHCC 0190]|uniref:o-succinylbenzoate synthase n=1 Tax=Crocosphaera sp. UHCC 0190 TaxID=3110246 RepID=UPI002B1FF1A9|nr:o-succinylbenzoate synthase [Crocosphaera sp. UHCC 0190]MEA5509971.1 o-succinylbenzoate synthase [Crocosphaera sp. UHCC 0190]
MIIESAEIFLFELPLIKTYRTSFAEISQKRSILAKLSAAGMSGYGEGSTLPFPFYVPDYADTSFLVLKDFILPQIIGKNIENPAEICQLFSHIKGYSFAKTAVETAFWDLYSQQLQQPLWQLLGGTSNQVQVGGAIGIIKDEYKLLDEVALNVENGVPRVKLKIEPGWDIQPLEKVRQNFPDLPLLADANSAYSLKNLELLKTLDNFNLMMIEQPLAWDDIVDHAELQKQIKTPICLDESILSVEDARKAIKIGACQIINIKPGRVGGLTEAKKIHDLCKSQNIGVWCGGMLESSVGRFFNLAIATLDGYIYPADMSSSDHYFADDIVTNKYSAQGGIAKAPDFLSDFAVNEEKLKKYTVSSYQFSL